MGGGMLLFEPPMEVFNESFSLGEIGGYKKKFMYIKIIKETKTHVFGRTVMYVCVCMNYIHVGTPQAKDDNDTMHKQTNKNACACTHTPHKSNEITSWGGKR